jgi:hypothetical protein
MDEAHSSSEKPKSAGWSFWLTVSLILLIVVTPLIFTPGYTDSHNGPRQNESAAVGSLRTVNTLESQYRAAHPNKGFACELSQLRPTEKVDASDPLMSLLTGTWSGYKFAIIGCGPEGGGTVTRYQASAIPIERSKTGRRAFCTDQSGKMFYDPDGLGSKCLASRRPI